MLLNAFIVLVPEFIMPRSDFGAFKLPKDILKVGSKRRPSQAMHVFDEDRGGAQRANSPKRGRKLIAIVSFREVLPGQAERLTWRTSGKQPNLALDLLLPPDFRDVILVDLTDYPRILTCRVVPQGSEAVLIELEEVIWRQSSLGEAKAHTTRSREQFDVHEPASCLE